MSNIVGSLIVKLVAQTAEFSAGMQKAVSESTKSAGQIQAALSGIGNGFRNIMAGLGVGFGIHQITGYLLGVVEKGDQIAKQADKLNMTAEAYQRIAKAADEGGVSVETIASAIQRMSAKIGSGKMDWSKIGLGPDAAGGSQLETFRAIAEHIRNIPNPMARAAAEMEAFGRSGMELESVLRNLEQHDWQVVSDEQIQRLREAKETLETIQQWAFVNTAETLQGMIDFVNMTGRLLAQPFGGENPNEAFIREADEARARNAAREQAAARGADAQAARLVTDELKKQFDLTVKMAEQMQKAWDERVQTAKDNAKALQSQFDPGFSFWQEMDKIADAYRNANWMTEETYLRAVDAAEQKAMQQFGNLQGPAVRSASPTGAEQFTQEAYRAILDIEKDRERNEMTELERNQLEELRGIRAAVEKDRGVDMEVLLAPLP